MRKSTQDVFMTEPGYWAKKDLFMRSSAPSNAQVDFNVPWLSFRHGRKSRMCAMEYRSGEADQLKQTCPALGMTNGDIQHIAPAISLCQGSQLLKLDKVEVGRG